MSAPWWGREASPKDLPVMVSGTGPSGIQPRLLPDRRGDVLRELMARAAAFVPEWTNARDGDAGYALARLFSELAEPVLQRLNRLPEKTFVEFLRTAGVNPLAQQPARVLLSFVADAGAPASVLVPQGFQVSAPAADGSGETVVFETERNLMAAPLTITAAFRKTGALFEEIALTSPPGASDADAAAAAWRPFGDRPQVGAELAVGLAGTTAPRPTLALALDLQALTGAAAPVADGFGVDATPGGALLKWEVLDGTSYEPAALLRDESRGFTQSGIVELRLPDRWRLGRPDGIDRSDQLFWFRVRLIHGSFAIAPLVRALHLNTVEANAVRTLRDEVLEYVPSSDRRKLRLSQVPVLPGTLDLVVLESNVDGDVEVPWHAVDNLAAQGPDDRTYVLDSALGELSFGDGVRGTRLPRGFRNVIARRYQVGGGLTGRVAADSDFTLVQSVPFLTGASNPLPASGGRDVEARADTLSRGPAEIRARGRAVTLADYELLATQTPGADVERAHAISGRDVRFPGAVMPGTVSVLAVSSDRGAEPPLPDAGTLETLAERLVTLVAPAGIRVIAAAPRFQRVAVRGTVVLRDAADVGATIEAALRNLQDFLHPLRGGAEGKGWPFGGVIRYQALVRMLLDRTPGLLAVHSLNLVLDGVLRGRCQDCPIAADALIWPGGHELVPADAEGAS